MPTGQAMIDLAKPHIGELYESVVVPKNDPNWHGPWDCAEFLSWLVYQVSQQLYGCVNDETPPATADAYTGGWESDSANLGRRVSIQQAAATAGGILLRYPPVAGAEGHAVICDGIGGTVEAKNSVSGVVADTVQDRYWDTGVLIPNVSYGPANTSFVYRPPLLLYAIGAPNMIASTIMAIQRALAAAGFGPGPIDGIFGQGTAGATANYQRANGLVADGQVGVKTAAALHVKLTLDD